MDINPKAHALMPFDALQKRLALDVPQHDASVLAGGGDKGLAVEDTEAATHSKLLVEVALVRLLDTAGDVVPETDAVVEVEGQDEPPIRGEADVGDGRVVFMNEGTKTLACRGIPDTAVLKVSV